MTEFVNLTPYMLNIIGANGRTIYNISPKGNGNVAMVSSIFNIVGTINGISVSRQSFGKIMGLPDAQDGVIYIVSQRVKNRVPDRNDVMVPGASVRDEKGNIIGAWGLSL